MNDLAILIVDDDEAKTASVVETLIDVGVEQTAITTVSNATSAKRLLRQVQYSLVIVDIALPLRDKGDPDPDGGLALLDEIKARDLYLMPEHIIGLTAYQDIFERAGTKLGNELWSVVFYDASSDAWVEQIQGKVRHILRSKTAPTPVSLADIAIITALQDPELEAILNLPWKWEQIDVPGDASIYHRGSFKRANGSVGTAVASRSPNMGMSSAAIQAVKMCLHFKPKCLVMTGICAGTAGDIQLGDIVVANPTWDYGSGKFSDKDGQKVFETAQYQLPITTRVRGIVDRLAADPGALDTIRRGFFGQKPDTTLTLAVGPLASGAAVVADAAVYETIKAQHRKLLGVDMEAHGVMLAAQEMPYPSLEALVMKGVSDFANEKKDDRFRHYAAYVSAQALRHMAESMGL